MDTPTGHTPESAEASIFEMLLSKVGGDVKKLVPIVRSPQKFIETFIDNPENDKPLKMNLVQQQMMWALESSIPRNVTKAHRRSGKCGLASDRLYLADGTLTTYEEMVGKTFDLLTLVNGQVEKVPAFAEYNAYEEVYEVETEYGRKIVRNAAHPLFAGSSESVHQNKPKVWSRGWTPLADLKPGDLIAAPRLLPFELPGMEALDEEIKLIAYLIGDGALTNKCGVRFSQALGAQMDEVTTICSTLGIALRFLGRYDYSLCGGSHSGKPGSNPALNLVRKYGLGEKNSFQKRVPKEFFQMSLRQTTLFLSRLYSTDGWASQSYGAGKLRGSGEIGYASVSKDLIDDVQHLLLRFGVNSHINYKPKTNSYSLCIDTFEDVITFTESIGIYGKEQALGRLYQYSLQLRAQKYGRAKELTWEDGALIKYYEEPRPDNNGEMRWVTRRKIDVTPWRLKNAPAQCRWERITKITRLEGKQHTVGITVPEHHTYLTDFYEHNTACAVWMVIYLLLTRKNTKILFIAPFNNQIEVFFDELDRIIAYHPWIKSCMVGSTKNPYRKRFINGAILRGITTGSKSKSKAGSARGQGANYIFLDEVAFMSDEDFSSLKPIIMGDAYHETPIVFATSTPMAAQGQFFKWCTETGEGSWNKIKLTLLENPDRTPEEIEIIRNEVTERQWQTEYLCEFLNSGGTVFNLAKLKACGKPFSYDDIEPKPEFEVNPRTGKPQRVFWRTMGVDWDKYNRDGAGPTIAILDCDERNNDGYLGTGKLRVAYRESIPQSEYCLTFAVQRIIELNRIYNPDKIYVDAGGGGDAHIETLNLYGIKHPESGLSEKVVRKHFSEHLDVQDPLGGLLRKPFKQFMVNTLGKWIEDEALEYPETDRILIEQFSGYTIRSQTMSGERYSFDNEHIIDAVGLAGVAMYQIHSSPFRHQSAWKSIVLPAQEVVPGEMLTDVEMSILAKTNPDAAALVRRPDANRKTHAQITGYKPPTVSYDNTHLFPEAPKGRREPPVFRRTGATMLGNRRRGSF